MSTLEGHVKLKWFMELLWSPCYEDNGSSDNLEISCLLCNSKVHHRVQNFWSLIPVLSHMNSVQIVTLILIVPSYPGMNCLKSGGQINMLVSSESRIFWLPAVALVSVYQAGLVPSYCSNLCPKHRKPGLRKWNIYCHVY
jgi:hypothetical protein